MKAGWTIKPLGELCEVIGGGTPPKDRPDYYGGDIPWATVRDMRADIINCTEHSITSEAVKASATNIIPAGNVVIATRVGLGKVCLLAQDTAVNQDLRGIVPKSNKEIDIAFLFAWFKSISEQIIAEGTGATVQGVKLPFIKGLAVPVPTMEEQRRIVTLLDKAFADIATAKANAEKNLQNARVLFESYRNSVFESRGSDWVEVRLGELCDFLNGFAFKSGDAVDASGTQLVRMGNLYGGKLDLERNAVYYPDTFASEYQRFLLHEGDIIMSLTGTTGKEDFGFAVQVPETDRSLLMNQRIVKFESIREDKICREYLLHYLCSRVFLNLLYPTANGTRQANLSSVTMKMLPVPTPSVSLQQQIARSLDSLEVETQHIETIYRQKLTALDDLKKSLLHQAFSGQL